MNEYVCKNMLNDHIMYVDGANEGTQFDNAIHVRRVIQIADFRDSSLFSKLTREGRLH